MTERDPNGLDQHAPGAKCDLGKNRLHLVLGDFSHALWAVGEVGTYGARKYSEHGWSQVSNGPDRYLDAMYRHLLIDGEIDHESGLKHLAHACWNLLAALELELRNVPNP